MGQIAAVDLVQRVMEPSPRIGDNRHPGGSVPLAAT
jgi:hypothetical protein